MAHPIFRVFLGLIVGALGGMAALAAVYARHPAIEMEMDGGTAAVTGLYDVERAGQETFAWTRREAVLRLPGLDRRVPWSCTIRLRGARADVSTLPDVSLSVDGVIASTAKTANEYEDLQVTLPPRAAAGAVVALTSSNTVQPGPSDPRMLGVMIDRWTCEPAAGTIVRPPRDALEATALAGAAFGAALAIAGAGAAATAAGALAIAIGQAVPIGWQFGILRLYTSRVPPIAFWIAALLAASVLATEWIMGRRLHRAARFVAVFTAAAFYLKLLVLLHPSKPLVDALFHAHRLMWVLDGRYFFTQPMPSGVQFPYAIGLYVFAMPWTALTRDYVLLLRIIVSGAEATGYLLAYLLVSRAWGDRLAGAIAAVLFSVVPRLFEIVGNANMTNAFGQSVAFGAVAAAVVWRLAGPGWWWQFGALTALTAFALLCHVSTITLLGATLLALAALYWWRGRPELRVPAGFVLAALAIAAVLSVGIYYSHFGSAFRSAARVRASAASSVPAGARPEASVGLVPRARQAASLSVAAVGWPMIALALTGAAPWWRRGLRDRLSLAVAAWMGTFVVFVVGVVLTPVGQSFLRYAAEFITRVTLATFPAIVILAGLGSAWALRRGWVCRLPAAVLLVLAFYGGVRLWIGWIR
jgi:hypothetical protein